MKTHHNEPQNMGMGLLALLLLLSLLVGVAGLCAGSEGMDWHWQWQDAVVQDIRWPRTLGAWLAGALLGLAGALAQGLFRNPLADPYLLGSASGAALGVAAALSLGWSVGVGLELTGMAFVGAWAAVGLTLLLARGVQHTLRLLLAGVVVGVVLGAVTSLLMLAVPQAWPTMQSFLLGNTSLLSSASCWTMAAALAFCGLLSLLLARVLDGLVLGESTALSLGLPVTPVRMLLVAVLALATATSVAQTGLIAFVGLVAPHLVRSRTAMSQSLLLVLSACTGGVLLTSADVLARAVWPPHDIPVGILTALLGGAYLLLRLHGQPVSEGL